MSKIAMGPKTMIYPTPVVLAGAVVDGKPNFMTAAWSGVVNSRPPMVYVSLQHHRHTLKGIRQNLTFSVNIPSSDMVKETDYCGIISGSKVDKVDVCKFTLFKGTLDNCPLIEQCPVNLECKVVHMLDLGSHLLVIGRVEESHVSESCLTDGKPDIAKIKPFAYAVAPSHQYFGLGEMIGKAFSVGEDLKGRGA